jgi:hypothetical protein
VEKPAPLEKKPGKHLYDDEKLENMLRYYNLEDNFDSLLTYIKRRGLIDDEAQ